MSSEEELEEAQVDGVTGIYLIQTFKKLEPLMFHLLSLVAAEVQEEVEASSSSRLCWNSSLFSLMKCFCISDIWAMIFSLRRRAISAFLLRSALSLSRTACRGRSPREP